MRVTITGIKNEKITRKLLKEAITYMAPLVMSKRLLKTITLNIKFIKDYEHNATCYMEDDDERIALIEIKKGMSRESILCAIAHELVHIKQYVRKELIFYSNNSTRYCGKLYSTKKMEYWDYPWEIEAMGKEVGLYYRYSVYLKKEKGIELQNIFIV